MTSSAISFAYFPYFSNTNISGTNADICKQQTAFFSFMEFYVIHLKNQGVKFGHSTTLNLLPSLLKNGPI